MWKEGNGHWVAHGEPNPCSNAVFLNVQSTTPRLSTQLCSLTCWHEEWTVCPCTLFISYSCLCCDLLLSNRTRLYKYTFTYLVNRMCWDVSYCFCQLCDFEAWCTSVIGLYTPNSASYHPVTVSYSRDWAYCVVLGAFNVLCLVHDVACKWSLIEKYLEPSRWKTCIRSSFLYYQCHGSRLFIVWHCTWYHPWQWSTITNKHILFPFTGIFIMCGIQACLWRYTNHSPWAW